MYGLNNTDLFPHSSEDLKFKVKALYRLGSSTPLFSADVCLPCIFESLLSVATCVQMPHPRIAVMLD